MEFPLFHFLVESLVIFLFPLIVIYAGHYCLTLMLCFCWDSTNGKEWPQDVKDWRNWFCLFQPVPSPQNPSFFFFFFYLTLWPYVCFFQILMDPAPQGFPIEQIWSLLSARNHCFSKRCVILSVQSGFCTFKNFLFHISCLIFSHLLCFSHQD